MNFLNLAFIVAICAVNFFFASCDDAAYYQKMRDLAIGCTKGPKSWKDPDSPCNSCSCMSDGVVLCTRMKCGNDYNPVEPEENPTPEPEAEPEPEPEVEPELEPEAEVESQGGDAKVIGVYKKLRDVATGCTPGQDMPTDSCAGCNCILPGVMRCTNAQCLLSDGQKLTCLGFHCDPHNKWEGGGEWWGTK